LLPEQPGNLSVAEFEFHELIRRGKEDDYILNVPENEKEAARLATGQRRDAWELQLARMKATANSAQATEYVAAQPSNVPVGHANVISRFKWIFKRGA
jgi:hypothetical protein